MNRREVLIRAVEEVIKEGLERLAGLGPSMRERELAMRLMQAMDESRGVSMTSQIRIMRWFAGIAESFITKINESGVSFIDPVTLEIHPVPEVKDDTQPN